MVNPYENTSIYAQNQKLQTEAAASGNSRDTDARALISCARRLDDAKTLMESDLKSKENLRHYGEAIRHNQRLWTIFQVALSDPENPLPDNLKLTLLNLSKYVDQTSFRAVGSYAPDLIDSLININRIIAKGLAKPVEQTAAGYAPTNETRDIPTSLMTSA